MTKIYDDILLFFSSSQGLDEKLVKAICIVESGLNTYLTRYEAHWKYTIEIPFFAKEIGTTVDTEKINQMTSWGLMQVMGSVAREQGFDLAMPMLCLPEHGIEMGCKKLASLSKRYLPMQDVIASYNAGHAHKSEVNGKEVYDNQEYVDKVMRTLNEL